MEEKATKYVCLADVIDDVVIETECVVQDVNAIGECVSAGRVIPDAEDGP